MDFDYIDSNDQLRDFCASVRDDQTCALDTEFVREKTYYPLLALIQLATESRQACIDPLAINDFSPLIELFENPDMVKILHASGQDLELFHHVFGAIPRPLFDTQIAAAVLGYANQIGYADLVRQVCGVQLDKKYTRANWAKRPLSEGELDYAMDDVRYLIEIYHRLHEELERRGRLAWVEADFRRITDAGAFLQDDGELWKKLKGVQRLKGEALNNADQLCRWREQRAREKDRPRRWILKDEDIVDIARFKPKNHRELAQIGNLGSDFIRKTGDELIAVLEQAARMDKADWPRQPKIQRLDNRQQALADSLMAIARLVCDDNDIAIASVLGKKDIDALITGQGRSKLLEGWRHEMLGRHLEDFLAGHTRLLCRDGRLEMESV